MADFPVAPVNWGAVQTPPNWQGLVNANEKAMSAFGQGQDTGFNQNIQSQQNARAWDQNARGWDENARANAQAQRQAQLFPYLLDKENFDKAERAQNVLGMYGDMARDAQTPEEWALLIKQMKARGVDTSAFEDPNWQVGQRRLQLVSNDAQRRLAIEQQKAEIALKIATAHQHDPAYMMGLIDNMFAGNRAGASPQAPQAAAASATPPQGIPVAPGLSVGTNPMTPASAPPQAPAAPPAASPYSPGQPQAPGANGSAAYGRGAVNTTDANAETQRRLKLAVVAKQLGLEYDKLPEVVEQTARAKARGTQTAEQEKVQQATLNNEQILNRIEEIAKATPPDVFKHVHGALNSQEYMQRAYGLMPFGTYRQAYDIHNQLEHNIHLLANSAKSGGSTDQQQAILMDAVGAFMKANDPDAFFHIINDARNGLRASAGLPPYQAHGASPPAAPPAAAAAGAPPQQPAAPTAPAATEAGVRKLKEQATAIRASDEDTAAAQRAIEAGADPDKVLARLHEKYGR